MSEITGPVQAAVGDSEKRTTTAEAAVGQRVPSEDGEFVYIKAGAALGAVAVSGEPVSLAGGLDDCQVGDSDTGAFIGIAEAPFASGDYGYIRVKGPCLAIVESGAVAGDELQLSATAGKLKKITTSGTAVAIAREASDNASAAHKSIYLLGR